MPREGYKLVTIKKEVFEEAKKESEKRSVSIASFVEQAIKYAIQQSMGSGEP